MGLEIERKFLVDIDKWNQESKGSGCLYKQGYILSDPEKTIRIRLTDTDGYLTIKGLTHGATRQEYEYLIPAEEAMELLYNFASNLVEKIRYKVRLGDKTWEVDEFMGANEGLVVAEIELNYENEPFESPKWLGKEVTSESRYYNSNLAQKPYSQW
jgi:Uncharacterized protein conserved in bacteria